MHSNSGRAGSADRRGDSIRGGDGQEQLHSTPLAPTSSVIDRATSSLEQLIRNRPGLSLAVCLTAGVLLGCLVKRK